MLTPNLLAQVIHVSRKNQFIEKKCKHVRNGDVFMVNFNPMVESGFQGDWKPTGWMSTNPGLIWMFPKMVGVSPQIIHF